MNILFPLFRFNALLGQLISKRIDHVKYIRYLHANGKSLSSAQQFEVLRDIEKVRHAEMKLSEYVDKWGTMYLDEKIWPSFIVEREDVLKKEPESGSIFSRLFKPTFIFCIFLLSLFLSSCTTKDKNQNIEKELPRSYVYVDFLNILHVKSDCPGIAKRSNAQPVAPVHIYNIESRHLDKVCSRCVHEADIRELTAIIENNKELNNK